MPNNRPPKINPTGTKFSRVPVWSLKAPSTHSKQMEGMLKIMGEYIRADYVVRLRTYREGAVEYADLTCEPPLFEGMT